MFLKIWFCGVFAFITGVFRTLLSISYEAFSKKYGFMAFCRWLCAWIFIESEFEHIPTCLNLSRRRCLSYRNQSIDLLCKSMDCFLYDKDLFHHRRVKYKNVFRIPSNMYDVTFRENSQLDDRVLVRLWNSFITFLVYKKSLTIGCHSSPGKK